MPLRLGLLAGFAAALDLELARTRVCLACLSFVSASLRKGDEREARSWTRRLTPDIWIEGLAAPALEAVRQASSNGLRYADAWLDDLEGRGGQRGGARAHRPQLGRGL